MAFQARVTFTYSPPPIVVDASVAIEMISGNDEWREAFDSWGATDRILLAPSNFFSEVANGLMLGHLRLSAADARSRLELLVEAGVEVVGDGRAGLFAAMTLCEALRLTVYDALYLQLAIDVDAELATLDRDLRAAAKTEGVALTG